LTGSLCGGEPAKSTSLFGATGRAVLALSGSSDIILPGTKMLTALAFLALVVALIALAAFVWLWLSSSWEIVEDDEFAHRIPGSHWFRGWFGRKDRLLTYRRDHLGRFRKYRR